MMRKIAATLLVLLGLALLTGCNTMHGIGKDIESGGKAVERASGKQ